MSKRYRNGEVILPTIPDDVFERHILSFLGPMTWNVRLLNKKYYLIYKEEVRKMAAKIVNESRKKGTRKFRNGIYEQPVHVVLQSPERKLKGLYFSDEKESVVTLIPYLATGWRMIKPNYNGNFMINQSRYPRRRLLPPPDYLL